MKCPSCGSALAQMSAGDIELDVCKNGCGGVWFDKDELLKFDEPHEFDTHPVLELAKLKEKVRVDHGKRKHCPNCADEPLVRQFFDVKNEVEIDQCWSCAGIWLDVGEINTVRAQYKTTADRAKDVNAYVDDVLKNTKASMNAETQQWVAEHGAKATLEEMWPIEKQLYYIFSRLLR